MKREKVEYEDLKHVTVFDKPKYACVFGKEYGGFLIDELWGVGYSVEHHGTNTTKDFKFLFIENGVLSAYEKPDFILLNELPSRENINIMMEYIKEGGDPSLFTVNDHMKFIEQL